jgi:hypothetical protein
MFDARSRYARLHRYIVTDRRGRQVEVVPVAPAPDQPLLGLHVLRQGERLDHLSATYLDDPTGYGRIAERNDVMWPDALLEDVTWTTDDSTGVTVREAAGKTPEIEIPVRPK